jgi:hypothetical protein
VVVVGVEEEEEEEEVVCCFCSTIFKGTKPSAALK